MPIRAPWPDARSCLRSVALALLAFGASASAATAACRVPLISMADFEAIERAVIFLPAVGSKLFPMTIGAILPPGIETKPVPRPVAKILPKYAGYRAYRSGHQLVIVDPKSQRIVHLLRIFRGSVSSCS